MATQLNHEKKERGRQMRKLSPDEQYWFVLAQKYIDGVGQAPTGIVASLLNIIDRLRQGRLHRNR